jgi:translation initiation factor IF-1
MSKEDLFVLTGQVAEVLPNALFRIKLENEMTILGHLAGKLRVNNINVLLNDTVDIEVSPYDLSKGRIIRRHKRVMMRPAG